ncbi:MAG: helix-turn-helix transcriptional regulator [Clostridia bacterium]|nr:helix-turn-helix transcriptional regulator [Clostridia bacterium]
MEENTLLINKTIAQNLIAYRKKAGLTQAELAEKINYSDKSVSKWESGNGVPDIYILIRLAEIFGVTVNDLVSDSPKKTQPVSRKGLHTLIILLSSGIVWLVATFLFALLSMLPQAGDWWLSFVFALPINAIVVIVFSGVWKYKTLNFISVSALIWTALAAIFFLLTIVTSWMQPSTAWFVFLIGVPLQVLEILWSFFRYSLFKSKTKKNQS